MVIYLKFLAICYLIGFFFHLLDLFDLREKFSQMNLPLKVLTIVLLPGDSLAAIGLWLNKDWGILIFVSIAIYELICFLGFPKIYGKQTFFVVFHFVTLSVLSYFLIGRFS